MRFIADFHIHSPYSRAVSKQMTLENLDIWAQKKGIGVISTGDFTHPNWFRELQTKLEPAEQGLYALKSPIARRSPGEGGTRFILTAEVSNIYSKNNALRRVHNIVFFPSLESVEKFNARLLLYGAKLASDGRPIIGMDSKQLLEIALESDRNMLFVPAHAWTPWFSVFGSKSGFDTLEECFEDLTPHIHGIETGLSSDPGMNWRLSKLDKIAFISNSDSHSLSRIGREANIFDTDVSYDGIADAIKTRDPKKFLSTIEFFPEEGKYHYDGHRACNISFAPAESKIHNFRCPVCARPLTIGVMARVDALADRAEGFRPAHAIPFRNMVPLDQIIAEALDLGVSAKAVWKQYDILLSATKTEFSVLFETPTEELRRITKPEIAEGIVRVRESRLHIKPGYDGEYGEIKIFTPAERRSLSQQVTLL